MQTVGKAWSASVTHAGRTKAVSLLVGCAMVDENLCLGSCWLFGAESLVGIKQQQSVLFLWYFNILGLQEVWVRMDSYQEILENDQKRQTLLETETTQWVWYQMVKVGPHCSDNGLLSSWPTNDWTAADSLAQPITRPQNDIDSLSFGCWCGLCWSEQVLLLLRTCLLSKRIKIHFLFFSFCFLSTVCLSQGPTWLPCP